MNIQDSYDVVILGGGLAGLTLSMQLKTEKPDLSICVLERRKTEAVESAHKVGESTVELGTYYLREVLGLKDYLDQNQLPKYGLRFYFTPSQKDDLTKRTELGPKGSLKVPSHQIDRGVFENELYRRSLEMGNDVFLGARVDSVDMESDNHVINISRDGEKSKITSKWVADATGRRELLKRSLGNVKPLDHENSAVWFRVNEVIDVEDWSTEQSWKSKVPDEIRKLGTIHFLDEGYWLWLIPLSTNVTSVGIVFDHTIHNLEELNSLDKAFEWMSRNEPQVYKELSKHKDKVLDFIPLRKYPHDCGEFYSHNRWAVVGEAGAFLDPFYSPGTDFIALSNSWATDLITRDLSGEDVFIRSKVYDQTHKALINNWLPIYKNQYQLMGCTQIMMAKIYWDFATYWSLQVLVFMNKGFTDIDFLSKSSKPDGVFTKLGELNSRVQQLFIDAKEFDTKEISGEYSDPLDIQFLKDFNVGMEKLLTDADQLMSKMEENLIVLEEIAADMFLKFHSIAFDSTLNSIDVYSMELKGEEHKEGVVPSKEITRDVSKFWYY